MIITMKKGACKEAVVHKFMYRLTSAPIKKTNNTYL